MELTLRTLEGNAVIRDLQPSISVQQLKHIIYDAYSTGSINLNVPLPENQRLVYMDKVLDAGNLAEAGISGDDTLVLLAEPEAPSAPAADTTPLPTAASIKAAIVEEAKARGIESQLREEAPPRRPFDLDLLAGGLGGLGNMDNRLLQILADLEGRLNLQAQPGAAGAAGAAGGGPPDLEALTQAAQDAARLLSALVGPGGAAQLQQLAGQPLQAQPQGAAGAAAAAPRAPRQLRQPQPEPPLQVPEPSAQGLAQLAEMGFSEALARKALLLSRNNVDAALEWVLQHMEDEDAEAAPSEEQLRQVYGRPMRPTMASLVNQLADMGFDRNAAAAALQRFNTMDLAVAYLLQTPNGGMAAGAGGARVAAAAAAAADGAASPQQAEGAQPAEVAAGEQVAAASQAAGPSAAEPMDAEGVAAAVVAEQHEEEQGEQEAQEEEEDDEFEDAHGAEEYEEDEYEMYDEEEEEEEDEYGEGQDYHIELGRFGSLDLANMGSADMEQLLEGVEDIYAGHLPGMGGAVHATVPLQDLLMHLGIPPSGAPGGAGAAARAAGAGEGAGGGDAAGASGADQAQQEQDPAAGGV